jgi:hypothetical protein
MSFIIYHDRMLLASLSLELHMLSLVSCQEGFEVPVPSRRVEKVCRSVQKEEEEGAQGLENNWSPLERNLAV